MLVLKMKIVFLNIYNGLVDRGAERSTQELASYLAKKQEAYLIQGKKAKEKTIYKTHVVSPICPKHKDTSFSFWRKFYLDCWSLQIFIFTLKAVPFLLRERFDIVIPVNGGWQTVLCKIITWIQKSKMVIIGRAGIGRDDAWNLLWKPDAFVALTGSSFDWAKKRTKNVNVVYIPNGVDLKKFRPDVKPVKIPLKLPVILYAGALTPDKNIEKTIRAVARLRKASLVILGKGFQYQSLKQLGDRLLGRERFLITSVPPNEMPNYYTAVDLFTFVSREGEAFGNVYLEAMASNLPVVAGRDEARKDIIGEAGFLVDSENLDEYAEALKKALERDFGDIPRKQAEKFSMEKIGRLYEKLFESIKE